MKRVKCPKCDNYLTFDETKYKDGQSLVFQCHYCNKQFGIRINKSKQAADTEQTEKKIVGNIVVIENKFHYKQILPLQMGDNKIGRYMKGCNLDCPIETDDPSVDIHHCVINVSRKKNGELVFTLSDGPSYTGTFVGNQILGDRERRILNDGDLFTIGATSILLEIKA